MELPFEVTQREFPQAEAEKLVAKYVGLFAGQPVWGEGPSNAKVVVVGEAPGELESKFGRPFIGQAGELLRSELAAVGLNAADCYITNAVKRRPINDNRENRPPTAKEIDVWREGLWAELRDIKPDFVLVLGNSPLKALFPKSITISRARGTLRQHEELSCQVYATYHPAYILRNRNEEGVFRSDLRRFKELVVGEAPPERTKTRRVLRTVADVVKLRDKLLSAKEFSFDLETKDLDWYESPILCVSFAVNGTDGYVLPIVGQELREVWSPEDKPVVLGLLREIMTSGVPKGAQNSNFDMKFLLRDGIGIENVAFDTLIEHHLLDENLPHDLAFMLSHELGEVGHAGVESAKDFSTIPERDLWRRAASDSSDLQSLHELFTTRLQKTPQLWQTYNNLLMPLNTVLTNMEMAGVCVDTERTVRLKSELVEEAARVEQDVFGLIGREINLNSSVQLSQLLFEERKLPVVGRTGKGAPSTNEAALRVLASQDEAAAKILEWRDKTKQISTFLDGLLNLVRSDGRVHPHYRITGTVTWRLSCVPTDSEILTRDGWKRHTDLTIGETVVGYNTTTRQLEWCAVTNVTQKRDKVGLLEWRRGADTHSGVRCTPDHRWVGNAAGVHGLVEAQRLPAWAPRGVGRRASAKLTLWGQGARGVSDTTPEQAALVGWAITDGYIRGASHHKKSVAIRVAKATSIQALRDLLVHFEHTEHVYKYTGGVAVEFYVLASVFDPIWNLAKNNLTAFALGLTQEARTAMYDAMMEADGSPRKPQPSFGAQKPEVIDCFQALAFVLGKRLTSRADKKSVGFQHFSIGNGATTLTARFIAPSVDTAEEEVWCPTTTLGTWVMRQGNQVVITGNCSEPNLQQWPRDDEIRGCIVAPPGYVLIAADFSQIEMFTVAIMANEKRIIDIYASRQDLHRLITSEVWKIPPEEVTKEFRDMMKRVIFGVNYGRGAAAIAASIGIPLEQSQEAIERYFATFQKIFQWRERIKKFVRQNGYVETPWGLRRHWNFSDDLPREIQSAYEREAISTPPQSTAACITNTALVRVYNAYKACKITAQPIMQIHDAIYFYAKEDSWESDVAEIVGIMELPVPELKNYIPHVAVEVGRRWGDHSLYDSSVTPLVEIARKVS